MTPEVSEAVEQVRKDFPNLLVQTKEDGAGGAFVLVDAVPLCPSFVQDETWVGFHITFQYPAVDIYPHFVRVDLSRTDKAELGEATSKGEFPMDKRPAIQLSRKNNRHNPEIDTASLKLTKVITWLRNR